MTDFSFLNNIGIDKAEQTLKGDSKSPLSQLLTAQANEIVEDLRSSLDKHNADASGNLKQSIQPSKVSVKGSEVSIKIEAPYYWKFVQYGVNGTLINRGAPSWGKQSGVDSSWQAFEKSIAGWIQDRGITKPQQFSDYKSFNYVIRKNKREKGQIARPFYTDVVNAALEKELAEPISALMKRAITVKIVDPWQ
tara:strand:+ start:166 stop:744 length:579 start_codon:yes stop_codon:yes gene_type:complete